MPFQANSFLNLYALLFLLHELPALPYEVARLHAIRVPIIKVRWHCLFNPILAKRASATQRAKCAIYTTNLSTIIRPTANRNVSATIITGLHRPTPSKSVCPTIHCCPNFTPQRHIKHCHISLPNTTPPNVDAVRHHSDSIFPIARFCHHRDRNQSPTLTLGNN